MEVSQDKTVILLSMKGPGVPQLLKTYTTRKGSERQLRICHPRGTLTLPIKASHVYLGVKIGYGRFERETMSYRYSGLDGVS